MDIKSNPFIKNGWSIKGLLEGACGTYCWLAEKNVGQDTFLSYIRKQAIPADEYAVQDTVKDKGSEEAASLYFRIMLDAYIRNIKLQTEMSVCPNILCPDEYSVVMQDNKIGWDLYTRTRYIQPLREYLNLKGMIETQEVIRFGTNICTALEYCDQTGIGIKTFGLDNLFRSDDQYMLGNLVDIVTEEYRIAAGKHGTLLYMSPDMSKGQAVNYNSSAIYSLGLIMYWMLNEFRMPFVQKGEYLTVNDRDKAMARRLSGEAFPELPVSKELNDVLRIACAAEQRDRFQTAADFRAALENIKCGETPVNPPKAILYPSEHIELTPTNTLQLSENREKHISFIGKIRKKLGLLPIMRDKRISVQSAADVFISYSSKEYAIALQIKEILIKNDISCWMAPESIPVGRDYANEIPDAVENCKAFVLLLTENSQKSIWVPKELDLAMNNNIPVLPFHLDQSGLNRAFDFKLKNVQRLEAFNNFSSAMQELIRRIQELKKI